MHILCTICSDLINQAENIYVTKCGHVFHYDCLIQWIDRSQSCPQCRNKVTKKCMFRVYPTISNEVSGDDAETLQSRLDNAQLQLRQQATEAKVKDEKLASAVADLKKQEDALKSTEKKLVSQYSAVAALKEQLEYVKIQNKETQKLKEENESLKKNMQTLTGLQKVLNATSDEVEQMLEGYTDVRTVAVFTTALKRALCESEAKKRECRDKLTAAKQQLGLEKKNAIDWQAKYTNLQETVTKYESKIAELMSKRKASELDESVIEDSRELPVKKQRLSAPETSVNLPSPNISINTMVDRIENADSPYLSLKQGSLALSTLQRPKILGDNQLKPSDLAILNSVRNAKTSIFHKKEKPKLQLEDRTNIDLDISYDGLGGHSKLDNFPIPKNIGFKPKSSIPKLTSKHKLKRPVSHNHDIGAMMAKMRENK